MALASDETPLRLFLLGSLRVERGAQTIHLPTRKVESLLAYLALYPQAHSRDQLAALLWGDAPDDQARASLRVALSTLRKTLGDDLLLTDRETIQLNPGFPIWVDGREIERLRDLEIDAPISQSLNPLFSLYPGDLLSNFYDEWIAPERERLRAIYLDALLRVIQHARSDGDYARAIQLAQKLLDNDPANEAAHQHLIFCYAASGDRRAARQQYAECRRVLRAELDVAPAPATTALYERALAQADARDHDGWFTNLPTPLTSFVGREKEMRELAEILGTTRLVTLTGAGGCGKTRLAIQTATEIAATEKFKDGVWWVDLAALRDPALVPQSVALTFGLREPAGIPLTTLLVNFLRAKKLLLIVDNCEHLLDACAQLIGTLLSACPNLHIVATSREILNIGGETVWRVPSLASPDPARIPPLAQLRQFEAIQLFVARATAVAANWRLVENAAPVAQICARLDGIPLAIELATARLKVLSTQQIAARLDDRFNLLTGGSRTELPRHQTLRATMDWSYDLLSDAERSLLRRLSVFAGGFSLEAVEAVNSNLTTDHRPLTTVLDLLTSLIDRSLVVVEQKGNDTRYRLLETVRQYAREKFAQAEQNESEIFARRHRDWFLQFAEQAEPHILASEQLEWCERLERDLENFRAALTWSLAQTDRDNAERSLRLARALAWFWINRGYWNEAKTWFERALENPIIVHARAGALVALGGLEFFIGNPTKSAELYEASLALYRQFGDKEGIAFAAGAVAGFAPCDPARANALFEEAHALAQELNTDFLSAEIYIGHGMFVHRQGDLARASTLYASALDYARRSGNRFFIGNVLEYWGDLALAQGDDDHAAAFFAESLEVRRELGNKNAMANDLFGLGTIALHRQDVRQAKSFYAQALALRREMGNPRGTLECLRGFSQIATIKQHYARAARLLGCADALPEMLDARGRRAFDQDADALRARMGEPGFDSARAEGRALTLEQAIEYALENAADLPGL
jgi:non-specific serine/threonine protein kinase